MDIWTVLKACARRWYAFVPVLAVAMGFAYAQMEATPPAYLATSSAVLTGPALVPGGEPGEVIEVNPFESLGGSLNATTKVLVSLMDSAPKRDEFAGDGVAAAYLVSQDDAVIYFDVQGTDPDEVIASASRLVELLDVEVAALQGRPLEAPESRIRAVAVSLPSTAEEDPVAGIRAFAIVGALGVILAVTVALVTDALMQARRRRRAQRPLEAEVAPATAHRPAPAHLDRPGETADPASAADGSTRPLVGEDTGASRRGPATGQDDQEVPTGDDGVGATLSTAGQPRARG